MLRGNDENYRCCILQRHHEDEAASSFLYMNIMCTRTEFSLRALVQPACANFFLFTQAGNFKHIICIVWMRSQINLEY
jgi:hypothetical protein